MKEKEIRQLLPIGSVVRLNGGKAPIMIFGICQTEEETEKEFDYCGVIWPAGSMGPESNILFNHKDIDTVLFRGAEGTDREDFLNRLVEFYKACEEK